MQGCVRHITVKDANQTNVELDSRRIEASRRPAAIRSAMNAFVQVRNLRVNLRHCKQLRMIQHIHEG